MAFLEQYLVQLPINARTNHDFTTRRDGAQSVYQYRESAFCDGLNRYRDRRLPPLQRAAIPIQIVQQKYDNRQQQGSTAADEPLITQTTRPEGLDVPATCCPNLPRRGKGKRAPIRLAYLLLPAFRGLPNGLPPTGPAIAIE